jgi:DNA-binding IclR family transcriptional regulator
VSKIVERTLDFLELFARQKRPLSLSDISRLLNIPFSSCHDVLQALQERGFIYEVAPRGGYYPTLRMFETGRVIAENDPVLLRAEHTLRELRDAYDETVLLAKITGLRGTYLISLDSSQPLRVQLKVGDVVTSLHAASGGKTILGSLSDEELDKVLEEIELNRFTAQTVTDKASLRQIVEDGRRRGYYVNNGESIEGLTTVSIPVRWQKCRYIMTLAAPTARLQSRIEETAAAMQAAGRKLEMKTPL